jgi:hypothetical protein
MSKYKFDGWYTQSVTGTYTIEVEAYSEDEARELIKRGMGDVFMTEKACDQPEYDIETAEVEIV